jgi:hypothetical protein
MLKRLIKARIGTSCFSANRILGLGDSFCVFGFRLRNCFLFFVGTGGFRVSRPMGVLGAVWFFVLGCFLGLFGTGGVDFLHMCYVGSMLGMMGWGWVGMLKADACVVGLLLGFCV